MHQIEPELSARRCDEIAQSVRQAALVEQFETFTESEGDLNVVAHEACRVAAEGSGANVAGLLQYRADKDAFVLQAGIGWPANLIGRTRAAAELGTTAVLCWLTGQLVHFSQLDTPGGIELPATLVGRGVHGVVNVPIHGEDEAFGMLEVITMDIGKFTPGDLAFLPRIADSVAAAVALHASRAGGMEQATQLSEREGIPAIRPDLTGADYQQDTQFEAG